GKQSPKLRDERATVLRREALAPLAENHGVVPRDDDLVGQLVREREVNGQRPPLELPLDAMRCVAERVFARFEEYRRVIERRHREFDSMRVRAADDVIGGLHRAASHAGYTARSAARIP